MTSTTITISRRRREGNERTRLEGDGRKEFKEQRKEGRSVERAKVRRGDDSNDLRKN